jgi:hypothetical protein
MPRSKSMNIAIIMVPIFLVFGGLYAIGWLDQPISYILDYLIGGQGPGGTGCNREIVLNVDDLNVGDQWFMCGADILYVQSPIGSDDQRHVFSILIPGGSGVLGFRDPDEIYDRFETPGYTTIGNFYPDRIPQEIIIRASND